MNKETFSYAMSLLPDAYITEAVCYRKEKKKTFYPWLIAACMILLCAAILPKYAVEPKASDTEPLVFLSLEQALEQEPLGEYYPSVVPDGYALTGDGIGLYGVNGEVLSARYSNEAYGDELVIIAASKAYFGEQRWNEVQKVEKIEKSGSKVYIDGGNYGIYYSSRCRDLADIKGFEDMVRSAAYFMVQKGRYAIMEEIEASALSIGVVDINPDTQRFGVILEPISSDYIYGSYTVESGIMTAMTDDGDYCFTFEVRNKNELVMQHITYDIWAQYGAWIKENVPNGTVFRWGQEDMPGWNYGELDE